jgi:NAD(P)-dependent dehydrogenase (short-subunit alcohol dehydrogenase family)
MQLVDKVALITGGAKRIGKSMALALAREGCHVVIHYHQSMAEADRTAAELKALGVDAWTVAADLTVPRHIDALVPLAVRQAGHLDILINNAAIFPEEDFYSTTAESWDQNMAINLKAPFLLSQAFADHLPPARPGKNHQSARRDRSATQKPSLCLHNKQIRAAWPYPGYRVRPGCPECTG